MGDLLSAARSPGALLIADFVGPFVEGTSSGETSGAPDRYILVLQDYFSRYVRLFPCARNDGETAVRCLSAYIREFDRPRRFKSDNSPFNSETVRDFLKERGIVASFSLPHHPESQGPVERFNGPLVRLLRACVGLDHTRWCQFVEGSEWHFNSSFHESIGTSPFRVVFGREPSSAVAALVDPPLDAFDSVDDRLAFYDELLRVINANHDRAFEARAKQFNSTRSTPSFSPGDHVQIWMPVKQDKLSRSVSLGIVVAPADDRGSSFSVKHYLSSARGSDRMQAEKVFHVDRLRRIAVPRPLPPDLRQREAIELALNGRFTVTDVLKYKYEKGKYFFDVVVDGVSRDVQELYPQLTWVSEDKLTKCSTVSEYCARIGLDITTPPVSTVRRGRPPTFPLVVRPFPARPPPTSVLASVRAVPPAAGAGTDPVPAPSVAAPAAVAPSNATATVLAAVSASAAPAPPAAVAPIAGAVTRGRARARA